MTLNLTRENAPLKYSTFDKVLTLTVAASLAAGCAAGVYHHLDWVTCAMAGGGSVLVLLMLKVGPRAKSK